MPFDLALPLEWILEGGFWLVLARCLAICPVTPSLLGLLFESRWVPLSPKYQFFAFFPGNPFLALFLASSSTLMDEPSTTGVWQSSWMQYVILAFAVIAYLVLTFLLDKQVYSPEQMKGPTKVYHNLLYAWYGYLAVAMVVVDVSAQVPFWHRALIMLPGFLWLGCLIADNLISKEKLAVKFQTAHAGWFPIWREWKLRHLVKLRHSPRYVYVFPGSTRPTV